MIAGEHEFPGIPTQPTGLFARLINGFSYCHARWHFAWAFRPRTSVARVFVAAPGVNRAWTLVPRRFPTRNCN
jgi:hypothetical protein